MKGRVVFDTSSLVSASLRPSSVPDRALTLALKNCQLCSCADSLGELEEVLHQEGIRDVKGGGTTSGAMHRTWAKLKVDLGGGDHTLLVTAEQGEDELKGAYKEALEKELPFPVRQLLTTQFAHIQTTHDYVKAARDRSA